MIDPLNELIHDTFREQSLGEVIASHEIVGRGETNRVFLVQTRSEKVIFRANDRSEFGRFEKEAWCISMARQNGVPGPEVLYVGHDTRYAYMIARYLEGRAADELGGSLLRIWKDVGQLARRIHGIPVSGFGENLEDMVADTRFKWKKYLEYNVSALGIDDPLLTGHIISKQQSARMRQWFEELATIDFTFGLAHGDLSLKNVIVGVDDRIGLIDWGSAEAHLVPHHDFAHILGFSLNETSEEFAALLRGYGMTREAFELIREQVKSLQLLEATDHWRWANEKRPNLVAKYGRAVQKYIQQKEASQSLS